MRAASIVSLLVMSGVCWGSLLPELQAGQPPAMLRGPAFSPVLEVPMPESWKKKGITHTEDAQNVDLVINMDQQFYSFLEPFMAAFARQKGWKVKLIESTCGIAEGMLRKKSLDIGGFCCPPSATDRLPGLQFHTLGFQSVAIIVPVSNPVDHITMDQLRAIYQNRIDNWQQLTTPAGEPGPNLAIRPMVRPHCDTRPGHWRLILDNKDLFGPRVTEVGSIDDLILNVRHNPGAIGYEEMPTVRRLDKSGQIKALRINGVGPDDPDALADGRYPVYQVIHLSVWQSEPAANPKALEMVEYMKSQMERLDPASHFVPVERLRQAGWQFTGPEVTGEPPQAIP